MKGFWRKHTLNFKQPAGTSRGVLRKKESYFIILQQGEKTGVGECGLLRGLSVDDRPDFEGKLSWLIGNLHLPEAELYAEMLEFPSIRFGLEMALADLQAEDHVLYPSAFTRGEKSQPINGLIWMGDVKFMKNQVREKLQAGFRILKMKIGAVDLEEELRILHALRQEYDAGQLELRVDANGAFTKSQAKEVLQELAELEVHSTEQPIAAGQPEAMADLCETTPVPIALDEELIGLFTLPEKEKLLQIIKPQFIILKPSLIGGWRSSEEWIQLAADHGSGWWATSALESNIGLNAIAQWNFIQQNPLPSGLGTGSLYTNNISSPLFVSDGKIGYNPEGDWDLSALLGTD